MPFDFRRLYEGGPLEVQDGLLGDLVLDEVGTQPVDYLEVGGVEPGRLAEREEVGQLSLTIPLYVSISPNFEHHQTPAHQSPVTHTTNPTTTAQITPELTSK